MAPSTKLFTLEAILKREKRLIRGRLVEQYLSACVGYKTLSWEPRSNFKSKEAKEMADQIDRMIDEGKPKPDWLVLYEEKKAAEEENSKEEARKKSQSSQSKKQAAKKKKNGGNAKRGQKSQSLKSASGDSASRHHERRSTKTSNQLSDADSQMQETSSKNKDDAASLSLIPVSGISAHNERENPRKDVSKKMSMRDETADAKKDTSKIEDEKAQQKKRKQSDRFEEIGSLDSSMESISIEGAVGRERIQTRESFGEPSTKRRHEQGITDRLSQYTSITPTSTPIIPKQEVKEEEIDHEADHQHRVDAENAHKILRGMNFTINGGNSEDFEDLVWALNFRWENDSINELNSFWGQQIICDLIEEPNPRFPMESLLSRMDVLIDWDISHLTHESRLTRREQAGYDDRTMERVPLSFAVLPSIKEEWEKSIKKSPLSESIRLLRFEWTLFLLKMGANANEEVWGFQLFNSQVEFDYDREFRHRDDNHRQYDFDGPIIGMAIELVLAKELYRQEELLKFVRLLLSFGANVQEARNYLSRCHSRIRRENPQMRDSRDVDVAYPTFKALYKLLEAASTSIARELTRQLEMQYEITDYFRVHRLYETVCSLPHDKCLSMEIERHFKDAKREAKRQPYVEHSPVFAIIVGTSVHSINMNAKEDDFDHNPRIGSIICNGRASFRVFPCALNKQFPTSASGRVSFERLIRGWNIFIIPPHLNASLKSVMIELNSSEVDPYTILYGGLASLSLRSGEVSESAVKHALDSMHRNYSFFSQFKGSSDFPITL